MTTHTDRTELARLEYAGVTIQRWDEMLSLTDMWRAAGSDPQQTPAKWRVLPATKAFVEHVELTIGKTDGALFRVQNGGRAPHTRAHWQIGLAYAKYLSPEFHMWCNTVVRERMEGRTVSVHEIAGLSESGRREVGGIIKAVVSKALADVHAENVALKDQLAHLQGQVQLVIEGHDRTRGIITTHAPMLLMLERRGVPQKKRGGLVRRCSYHMARWCEAIGRMDAKRREHGTRTWLFDLILADEWFRSQGDTMIREHLSKLTGQTVMEFRTKPRAVPPSTGMEGEAG